MSVKQIINTTLLASLGCSSIALAAGMFPNSWKESDDGIWQFAVEGAYLDQSNNLLAVDNIFFDDRFGGISFVNGGLGLDEQDPNRDWGFGGMIGYIFPNKKYDIRGTYFGLRSNKDDHTSGTIFGTTSAAGNAKELLFEVASGNGHYNYNFNEADLTFGTYRKLAPRFNIRLGYGIAYVDLKQSSDDDYFLNQFKNPINERSNVDADFENRFWGLGPKFTLDGQFDLNRYIGIVGGLGVSGLFGKSTIESKLDATLIQNIDGKETAFSDSDSFEKDEEKFVVGFDGRLGLRLNQTINERFAWNVEGGYEGLVYLNALQETSFNSTLDENKGFTANSLANVTEDNYFNAGFYVRLGVDFM